MKSAMASYPQLLAAARAIAILCILQMALLLGGALPATAQTDATGSDLVTRLFQTRIISPSENLTGDAKIVAESFGRSSTELKRLITTSIAQLPTLSSGGFTYVTDPTTGEHTLRTYSLGPLFADRPITGGRRVWNVAFGFQRFSFDSLQSRSLLDDGVLLLDNRSTFADGFQQFIQVQSFFEVTGSATTFQATYGVHDNVDVGISVPILSLDITGRQQEVYDVSRDFAGLGGQVALARVRALYSAPSGLVTTVNDSRSASGLGDVAVRVKVALNRRQDAAITAELRLPTGKEEDFLGQGNVSSRVSLVVGRQVNERTGVSGSAGFTKSDLTDEFAYQGSVNVAAVRSRLTLGLDLLGRTLLDGAKLSQVRTDVFVSTDGRRSFFDRTLWTDSTLNLLQLAAGAKVHLSGLWVLTGSVIFQADSNGLKGAPIPLVALDRTWSR